MMAEGEFQKIALTDEYGNAVTFVVVARYYYEGAEYAEITEWFAECEECDKDDCDGCEFDTDTRVVSVAANPGGIEVFKPIDPAFESKILKIIENGDYIDEDELPE